MDLKTRQSIVGSLAKQYRPASKKDKGRFLEEFIRLTGYNRTYAAVLLSHPPRKQRRQQCRQRQSAYREVLPGLRNLWAVSDASCGKRLVPMIPNLVDALERHGEIKMISSPRFLEIDLVAHCGEELSGEYINSLDATDIATRWTECAAFIGRSRWFATQAIDRIKDRIPFPLLGVDSDNDAVFINAYFVWYCQRNNLTFTRCRPNRKNDQAHVEH